MDFMGKICPYCKTEFKEDDEVVMCSACEMPHHKECWIENSGCTTFGCTGTIMGVDDNNDGLVCRKCGTPHIEGQRFCSSCGNDLLNDEQILTQPMNFEEKHQTDSYSGMPYTDYNSYQTSVDEDVKMFIGRNEEYYFTKFQRFDQKNNKASWNWASAFFGSYWYAYRKMYLIQFLYYVSYFLFIGFFGLIMFKIFLNTHSATTATIIPLAVFILPFIFSGILGNHLYKRHVDKHVKRARSMEVYMKEAYLRKKGGTSKAAVWGIIGLQILLSII